MANYIGAHLQIWPSATFLANHTMDFIFPHCFANIDFPQSLIRPEGFFKYQVELWYLYWVFLCIKYMVLSKTILQCTHFLAWKHFIVFSSLKFKRNSSSQSSSRLFIHSFSKILVIQILHFSMHWTLKITFNLLV